MVGYSIGSLLNSLHSISKSLYFDYNYNSIVVKVGFVCVWKPVCLHAYTCYHTGWLILVKFYMISLCHTVVSFANALFMVIQWHWNAISCRFKVYGRLTKFWKFLGQSIARSQQTLLVLVLKWMQGRKHISI